MPRKEDSPQKAENLMVSIPRFCGRVQDYIRPVRKRTCLLTRHHHNLLTTLCIQSKITSVIIVPEPRKRR